jgi:thiol-disulfide isomerase/thioredoxin
MKRLLLFGALAACLAGCLAGADIPRTAPELTIALPGGKEAKLSDYKGNVVIVVFFLTTCPHCQRTTQNLVGIEKDFGPKGLRVLEGALDDNPDIPQFVQRFQTNFPVGAVDRLTAAGYMQLSPMVRNSVPFMLFVDRKGVIQAQYTGGDDFLLNEGAQDQKIRAEVQELLGKSAAKPSSTGRKHTT